MSGADRADDDEDRAEGASEVEEDRRRFAMAAAVRGLPRQAGPPTGH